MGWLLVGTELGKGEFVTNCGYIRENVTRVKL
jgi:hypothetical protein